MKDILDVSIILGEGRRSARLGKAKERREKLLTYLDRWWTTLEGGDPNLEKEMEPLPFQRGEKRKTDPNKKDILRQEERQDAQRMAGSMLDLVMDVMCVQHDCGYSTACPG